MSEELPLKKRSPLASGKLARERGRISEGRVAWLTIKPFELVYLVGDEEGWMEHKGVRPFMRPRQKVEFRFSTGRRSLKFELTGMTAPELKALKAFWNYVLDQAIPVSEELDELAQEAFEEGDDTYIRLYRPDPLIFKREERDGKNVAVPMEF